VKNENKFNEEDPRESGNSGTEWNTAPLVYIHTTNTHKERHGNSIRL
jgi:hypothetical protein